MKTKVFIFAQILIILWLLFSVFTYFFDFKSTSNCSLGQGCLQLGKTTWQIQLTSAHKYYLESFKTSVGLNSDKSHILNPIIYILAGVLFLYFANFVYERIISKKKILELKLSPFSFLIIFTVVFFISYQCWLNFYNLSAPIKFTGIFVRYPLILLQVGAIVLISLSVGRKIIKHFMAQILDLKDELAEFLFSFAFGLMTIILLLFVLALFKVLFFKYVLILMIVLAVLTISQIWFWLKRFFKPDIMIKTSFFDPKIFLFLLIIIFLAHNFLDVLRPMPIGFDDLTSYMNNSKTMAQEGYLLSGTVSHYWEIFTSTGIVLFKNTNVALFISFLGSLFSLISIYFITRVYFTARGFLEQKAQSAAMLSATFFYTLPMVAFQSSKDLKVDLVTVFFCALALFSLWQWRKYFDKNKKSHLWLYASGLLVGFAVAIKFTNLLFFGILLIYVLWIIFAQYKFAWKKYVIALFFVILAIAPSLPILVRNIYQTKSLSAASIRFGKPIVDGFKIDPVFSGTVVQSNYTKYMRNNSTGGREEVGRYIGYDKWWKKYLLLPFRVTTNPAITGSYIDIGFLFLAFVPLSFIFYFANKDKSKKKVFLEIGILAIIFWLGWAFVASNIIWYGLSGFIFLLLLLLESFNSIKETCSRLIYYFSIILVVFWFICSLLLRTTFIPSYNLILDPAGLKYARGEFDTKMYIDSKFQPYIGIIDEINKDIADNLNHPPIVYRVGTFYKYMIDYNDRTVLDDSMLDKFAFAYQDKDPIKMMDRFKNTGVKYLMIDRSLMNLDQTPEHSLTNKGIDFLNFLQQNQSSLKLLTDPRDNSIMIFMIVP